MKPVRPFLALACVLGLAAPAVAQTCLQPSELTALQIRSLQSRLMVGALACQQQDSYNAFVRRNQGDLNNAYRTAEGHFRRRGGPTAWNRVDTEIAALQSEEHSRLGGYFCNDTTVFFRQTASLNTGAQLARFANERNILQGYHAPICTGAAFGRASGAGTGTTRASGGGSRPAR